MPHVSLVRTSLALAASVGVSCFLNSDAQAAIIGTITHYQAQPTTNTLPEFTFDGTTFMTGPGSIGNADGVLPLPAQTAPGLQFDSPFTILGIPGSTVNIDGSTDFYDCSLMLGGLAVSAPAVSTPLGFGLVQLSQPLGNGAFTVLSTDPDGAGGLTSTVLLTGLIENAVITGLQGSSAGVTFSASITYTGGPLWTASGYTQDGDFSWSLTGITPTLSINGGTGFLSAFDANATGLFDAVVPEPTLALAGMAAGGLMMLRRRRA